MSQCFAYYCLHLEQSVVFYALRPWTTIFGKWLLYFSKWALVQKFCRESCSECPALSSRFYITKTRQTTAFSKNSVLYCFGPSSFLQEGLRLTLLRRILVFLQIENNPCHASNFWEFVNCIYGFELWNQLEPLELLQAVVVYFSIKIRVVWLKVGCSNCCSTFLPWANAYHVTKKNAWFIMYVIMIFLGGNEFIFIICRNILRRFHCACQRTPDVGSLRIRSLHRSPGFVLDRRTRQRTYRPSTPEASRELIKASWQVISRVTDDIKNNQPPCDNLSSRRSNSQTTWLCCLFAAFQYDGTLIQFRGGRRAVYTALVDYKCFFFSIL